jgi:hypothetical protein
MSGGSSLVHRFTYRIAHGGRVYHVRLSSVGFDISIQRKIVGKNSMMMLWLAGLDQPRTELINYLFKRAAQMQRSGATVVYQQSDDNRRFISRLSAGG